MAAFGIKKARESLPKEILVLIIYNIFMMLATPCLLFLEPGLVGLVSLYVGLSWFCLVGIVQRWESARFFMWLNAWIVIFASIFGLAIIVLAAGPGGVADQFPNHIMIMGSIYLFLALGFWLRKCTVSSAADTYFGR